MLRLWTVQYGFVLDVVATDGFCQTGAFKSPFVLESPPQEELYRFLLGAFNKANDFCLDGLIFGFAHREDSQIHDFQDIYEFVAFLRQKKNVINILWKRFCSGDYVILCLDYPEDSFNPLFIDMNDPQFFMPPITILPPYTYDSVTRIVTDIHRARTSPGELPNYPIQAHLPVIHKENTTEVYRMFSLNAQAQS